MAFGTGPRNYIVDAYNSLSRDLNKMPGHTTSETQQGVVSPKLPEISVDTDNDTILKTLDKYHKTWVESSVFAEWTKRSDENTNYWKGKHFQRPETDKTRALVDNVIFEAVETSLPQFIARSPEPDVELRRGQPTTPISNLFTDTLSDELEDIADDIDLRLKMKKAGRHWMLNLVGIGKVGWDTKRDIPMLKVIRPSKIILDPDATIDEDGYTGELVGEFRELPAYKIIPFLTEEGAEDTIRELVRDDLATKIQFIEWWSDTTLIWAIGGKQVLMKRRNPHWNWGPEADDMQLETDFTPVGIAPEGDSEMQIPTLGEQPSSEAPGRPTMPMMTKATSGLGSTNPPTETEPPAQTPTHSEQAEQDDEKQEGEEEEPKEGEDEEFGEPSEQEGPRSFVNHFPSPRKPYIFLVMFILGDQPMDNTSVITQNLANQDLINKRNKQIDRFADTTNNGLVVSLERSGLTAQQAKGVTEALRKGGVVGIPAGAPEDAVWRPPTPEMPQFIYENMVDLRTRVRQIMGTQGSSAQQVHANVAAETLTTNKTFDTDRIGGGISEILEKFAADFFNWSIQLKYVYEEQYVEWGANGIQVPDPQNPGMTLSIPMPKVRCTVQDGSLLPKDKVTLANQAIALAAKGLMSNLDLFTALEKPNAEELAANAWLEKNAPDLLYADDQRVQAAVKRMQQNAAVAHQAQMQLEAAKHPPDGEKPPSISIAYKDLPPDGQSQAAAKAGITLHPEGIAAHQQLSKAADRSTAPADAGGTPAP